MGSKLHGRSNMMSISNNVAVVFIINVDHYALLPMQYAAILKIVK